MTKAVVIQPKESTQRQIAKVLKEEGLEVELITRPERATDIVLDSKPDLLLIDIQMPKVDGVGLARQIKQYAPDLPIILLTAHPARLGSEAARLGATVFRKEPFKPGVFIAHLRTMIRDRRVKPPVQAPSPLFESLTAHLLLDLNDPTTGRLDARRMANYLSVPLSSLAEATGKTDAAVHKTPAATSLQKALAPIARSLAILSRLFRSRERVLAWLNSPHPDLGSRTPLSLILTGKATALTEMLEAVLAGQPF